MGGCGSKDISDTVTTTPGQMTLAGGPGSSTKDVEELFKTSSMLEMRLNECIRILTESKEVLNAPLENHPDLETTERFVQDASM
jgi:hypothetical protein